MSRPTVIDLFCGAGGSSTGAVAAGAQIVMAANHWQTAIDVHQANHPEARHDCADISQVDPRRYPPTDILLASPECTNHSQARGVSRRRQDPSLFDEDFDPAAERSRATMWCVGRFAESMLAGGHPYKAIVVENVVEATKWSGWPHWLAWLTDMGYEHQVLSHNSMHHGVAQSRDRIYVVFWRKGLRPDLELEQLGWCPRCDLARPCRQAWKNGRRVGRYRAQWFWSCLTCGAEVVPATEPAASIIDWSLDCPRIGDRARPLADKTRARILAGLQRHGWVPITTSGAGNTWEGTPGMRARTLDDVLPTQQTTAGTAMAIPPGFLFQTAHGGRVSDLGDPHPTVCASDDRQALVLSNNHHDVPKPVADPLSTVTTGNRHGVIVHLRGTAPGQVEGSSTSTDDPLRTISAGGVHQALVVRSTGFQGSGDLGRFTNTTDEPLPTCMTTQRPALLMRNNSGGAEMVTPVDEPVRALTTAGHQSLLMPYYGRSTPQGVDRPVPAVPTRDRFALVDPDEAVDDCGFRMLEPHEIAAAMAFPKDYIPADLSKKDRVKLAGNAVTPPVMTWIMGRVIQALEAAA